MRSIFLTLFILLLPSLSKAEILNVLSHVNSITSNGVYFNASAQSKIEKGNSEGFDFGGNTSLSYRINTNVFYLSAAGNVNTAPGTSPDKSSIEHLRYRRIFSNYIFLDSFAQHEYDQRERISLRGLLGTGPVVLFKFSPNISLSLGSAVMGEILKISNDSTAQDSGKITKIIRNSSFIMFNSKINEDIKFSLTSFIQPVVNDLSNYRTFMKAVFNFKMTKSFSLELKSNFKYDNTPAESVKVYDFNTIFGIKLSLDYIEAKKGGVTSSKSVLAKNNYTQEKYDR